MTEQQAERICVVGNFIKDASEKDNNIATNKEELKALCCELKSLISEIE